MTRWQRIFMRHDDALNPPPESEPSAPTEDRDPNVFDARWHYQSAERWLRWAEQPGGLSVPATQAAASIAQAHAALGSLAFDMATHVKHVKGRPA